MVSIATLWDKVWRLFLFLLPIPFSFFTLAAIALALLYSDQGYDIIAALAEDDPTGKMPPHGGQRSGFVVTIAEIVGVRPISVRTLLFRARKRLAAILTGGAR